MLCKLFDFVLGKSKIIFEIYEAINDLCDSVEELTRVLKIHDEVISEINDKVEEAMSYDESEDTTGNFPDIFSNKKSNKVDN